MKYDPNKDRRRGNCYYSTEALFHILGGRRAGWKAMRVTCTKYNTSGGVIDPGCTETHWFLLHESGLIVDPSRRQFRARNWWAEPDYSRARGSGFLTKQPSRRARDLMRRLTWQVKERRSRRSQAGRS